MFICIKRYVTLPKMKTNKLKSVSSHFLIIEGGGGGREGEGLMNKLRSSPKKEAYERGGLLERGLNRENTVLKGVAACDRESMSH